MSSVAIQLRIFVRESEARYACFTSIASIDSADTGIILISRMRMWYCLVGKNEEQTRVRYNLSADCCWSVGELSVDYLPTAGPQNVNKSKITLDSEFYLI